jgi:hypothetical protein
MDQHQDLADNLRRNRLTRRQVLGLFGAVAVSGYATSPIFGYLK